MAIYQNILIFSSKLKLSNTNYIIQCHKCIPTLAFLSYIQHLTIFLLLSYKRGKVALLFSTRKELCSCVTEM